MPGEPLPIGLIGAGRIGRIHAANLSRQIPTAELLMVADVDQAAAQQCAAEYRIPQATADYQAVLRNPAVAAVVICSSTDTHPAIIAEAAAGKQIFCEKPIALDLAAIDGALAAVSRAGVQLQIGFNRRFDPTYARVRQAIAEREIGALHLLHLISRDPAPPPIEYVRTSGGMFMDMTIHDFDMACFLTGSMAEEVYTQAAVTTDPAIGAAGDVDTAVVLLRFANGVIGTIDNCRRAPYGYDQRVEALGSGGAIGTTNLYPNAAVISDAHSVRRDLPLHFFLERYRESYLIEMAAFVEAVRGDRPVPVAGAAGRDAAVLAVAAQTSHREGRPVRISEIGR
jgi:myo-inositol 2-dehydrogenase/D-chiro-inositol 1-dehydrogenase